MKVFNKDKNLMEKKFNKAKNVMENKFNKAKNVMENKVTKYKSAFIKFDNKCVLMIAEIINLE